MESRARILSWLIRLAAILILLCAVSLPYARAANGEQPNLVQFLQRFLFIPEHRMLAPILMTLCAFLAASIVWPLSRPVLWLIGITGGLWGGLMLAIPLGMAHVRPVGGYWAGQGLLLCDGLLIAVALFSPSR